MLGIPVISLTERTRQKSLLSIVRMFIRMEEKKRKSNIDKDKPQNKIYKYDN